jgi:hypothetical protein
MLWCQCTQAGVMIGSNFFAADIWLLSTKKVDMKKLVFLWNQQKPWQVLRGILCHPTENFVSYDTNFNFCRPSKFCVIRHQICVSSQQTFKLVLESVHGTKWPWKSIKAYYHEQWKFSCDMSCDVMRHQLETILSLSLDVMQHHSP